MFQLASHDSGKASVALTFQTAWSPPIAIYNALHARGISVNAKYSEGGCAFLGIYEDGDDQCFDMPENSKDPFWDTEIGQEFFDIQEDMKYNESSESDDDTTS